MQVPQSALVTVGRQRLIRELGSTANAACVGRCQGQSLAEQSHMIIPSMTLVRYLYSHLVY